MRGKDERKLPDRLHECPVCREDGITGSGIVGHLQSKKPGHGWSLKKAQAEKARQDALLADRAAERAAASMVVCPLCPFVGTRADVLAHLRKRHRKSAKSAKEALELARRASEVAIDLVDMHERALRLRAHLRTCQPSLRQLLQAAIDETEADIRSIEESVD